MPGNYIEDKHLPGPAWGWAILILFSVSILGFGMWLMMAVPDVPREWNFGFYHETPAESVYSTEEPPARLPAGIKQKRVIPELPEADPDARIRTQGPAVGTQGQPPGGPSRWQAPGDAQGRTGAVLPRDAGKK